MNEVRTATKIDEKQTKSRKNFRNNMVYCNSRRFTENLHQLMDTRGATSAGGNNKNFPYNQTKQNFILQLHDQPEKLLLSLDFFSDLQCGHCWQLYIFYKTEQYSKIKSKIYYLFQQKLHFC